MEKEDKTIPFLDVLLIQEDGSLGDKVYRKPTHMDYICTIIHFTILA